MVLLIVDKFALCREWQYSELLEGVDFGKAGARKLAPVKVIGR
jgi:hypothetical protein